VLTIRDDVYVKFYVENQISLSGGGLNNASLDPSRLEILATGTGTKPSVSLGGGAELFAHVYAPTVEVAIAGGGNGFGSSGPSSARR
jgi:hypothetical protein